MNDSITVVGMIGLIIYFAWYILMIVQSFMAIGTTYRKTKANGDNGVALYGWLLVYGLVALIPYLGIHFWRKNKSKDFK